MKVKKTEPKNKNNKGFTLIEVLLAIVILSLVSAPILRGFIVTANTSARARKIMEATDVAQLVIEDISAMTFDGEVKKTFFDTDESHVEERMPAIGYTAKCKVITIQPSQFQGSVGSACNADKICYYNVYSDVVKMVALPNVEYDGELYDVIMMFEPNDDGVNYFTYDVTVSVYDQNTTTSVGEDGLSHTTYTHYQNKLVELKTQISNKY